MNRSGQRLRIRWAIALGVCFVSLTPLKASGESCDVVKTDRGEPLKVVVRKDCAVYEGPDTARDSRRVETFQFFYVIVFVVDTTRDMGPYIQAVKDAVERLLGKHAEQFTRVKARFGFVGYRDVISDPGDDWYVTRVFCDLDQGADHARFLEIMDQVHEAEESSEDIPEDVFAGLKVAIQKSRWNPDAFKHIFLIGDASAHDELQGPKNSEKLTLDGVVAMAQPLGRETVCEKITLHTIRIEGRYTSDHMKCSDQFQSIAVGNEYAGLHHALNRGCGASRLDDFLEEVILILAGSLEHVLMSGESTMLLLDSPTLGLLLQVEQPSDAPIGEARSFATAYCCEIDKEGNQVFEPFCIGSVRAIEYVQFLRRILREGTA